MGVVCGDWNAEEVLKPESGTLYTNVATSGGLVLLVRSDGRVFLHDGDELKELRMLREPEGVLYVQGAMMYDGSVFLLRSDGQVDMANLTVDVTYTGPCDDFPAVRGKRISAGESHAVLLSTDGLAFASGSNFHGQCNVPPLDVDTTYVQVSAGIGHTVVLRSDGCVVACGLNDHGQCDLPEVREGISVVQVGAGGKRTILICSDGSVLSCGLGAQEAPPLLGPQAYVAEVGLVLWPRQVVVQLVMATSPIPDLRVELLSIGGERLAEWDVPRESFANAFTQALKLCPLKFRTREVGFLLPDGSTLLEEWTCAQLANKLSEDISCSPKRPSAHESDEHAVKRGKLDHQSKS